MDALKGTMASMTELFNSQMNEFQNQLGKTSPAVITTTSLAADFSEFKKFMYATLTTMQNQIELLGKEIDRAETRSRRKMLLLHGVPEDKDEDTKSVVACVITEKLKIADFSETSINRCHRLGRQTDKKARPVIVKFKKIPTRDKVWFSKTQLKGSGITMSEFLTHTRHTIFLQARQRYGISSCSTKERVIYVQTSDGSRHQVENMVELDAIQQVPAAVSSGHQKTTETTASRPVVDKAQSRAKKAAFIY